MCSRNKEQRREQLSREVSANRLYKDYQITLNQIDLNSDKKLFLRRLNEEKREELIESSLLKTKETGENRELQIQQEEKLAYELAQIRRKQIHDEKMRQQLRESNQELKELEVKLRAAYVFKGLAAQKAEKQAAILQEKERLQKEHQLSVQAHLTELENLRKRKEEENKSKIELRNALQDQIITTHQQKQMLYEEFLKEKKILDEIVKRIYDEHIEDMNQKLLKKEKIRVDMEHFKKSQEIWKNKQKQDIEDENKRIVEFIIQREEKLKASDDKRQKSEEQRLALTDRMVKQLHEQEQSARKREELLIDLKIEELREKEEQKVRSDMERELRKRIETRIILEQQKIDNHLKLLQAEEEDKIFREEQIRFLAEKDKLDQLSDEKRRRKKLEHRKAIQDCIEQKRIQRAEEVAGLIKLRDLDVKHKERMQQLVDEERLRMLKEHAAALIGFLPPGILRESDREFLPLEPNKNI